MKRSVLTIGNFDGVHLGHRKLLQRVLDIAHADNLQSVVLSYTDHPAFTLKTKASAKMLCSAAAKQRELCDIGIDHVELLQFTQELAHTPALKFMQEYILPVWHPAVIVVGYDSHFGHLRQGNYQLLSNHANQYGYRVEYIEPLMFNDKPISSSMIRELLIAGHVCVANQLLGKSYRLSGTVGHGIARGKGFGFPTANLLLDNPHQLIPKDGIYLSRVNLNEAKLFGLTNIGSSPTVKKTGVTEIETYILDFDYDIYGQPLELELQKFLREEMMFNSVDELIDAMHKDLATARKLLQDMMQ